MGGGKLGIALGDVPLHLHRSETFPRRRIFESPMEYLKHVDSVYPGFDNSTVPYQL